MTHLIASRRHLEDEGEGQVHEHSVIDKIVFGLGGVLAVFSLCLCIYAMRSLYVQLQEIKRVKAER